MRKIITRLKKVEAQQKEFLQNQVAMSAEVSEVKEHIENKHKEIGEIEMRVGSQGQEMLNSQIIFRKTSSRKEF